jgi:hypothetical protein
MDKDETNFQILKRVWEEYKVSTDQGPIGVGNFDETSTDVTIKTHTYQNPDVDNANLINFSLNPSLIEVAMRQFPSTYDPIKGPWTEEYANSRNDFLTSQKWKKGKK